MLKTWLMFGANTVKWKFDTSKSCFLFNGLFVWLIHWFIDSLINSLNNDLLFQRIVFWLIAWKFYLFIPNFMSEQYFNTHSSFWFCFHFSLNYSNYDSALKVLRRATSVPRKKIGTNYHDQKEPVQNRVHKSIKVWSMYADLEESLGTFQVKQSLFKIFLGYSENLTVLQTLFIIIKTSINPC